MQHHKKEYNNFQRDFIDLIYNNCQLSSLKGKLSDNSDKGKK